MSSVALGDVAEFTMGQAPPGSACNREGRGTAFVRAGEFGDRFPDIVEWTTKPLKMANAGDTLVCVVGATAGKVNQAIDCAIGRSAAAVRPKNGLLDHDYLYRFMETQVEALRRQSQGLAQGVITREMLASLKIPLPSRPEQRRIAGILDQAEDLRGATAKHQESLARLATSIFQNHQRALNTAPRTLSSACRKITDGTHQAPAWAEEGIPFIFVSHVRNQRISLQTQKFISESTYAALTKHTPVEEGDVLYTCVGSYGHAALVPPGEKFLFQRHIAQLKPHQDELLPGYLVYLLESPEIRRQADARATGIAQKTVTLTMIKDFKVRIPEIAAQAEIMSKIDQLKRLELQSEKAVHRQDSLFASLQHRAFRGEL